MALRISRLSGGRSRQTGLRHDTDQEAGPALRDVMIRIALSTASRRAFGVVRPQPWSSDQCRPIASIPADLSARCCRASRPPAVTSVCHFRPRAPSASERRTRPYPHTWPSACETRGRAQPMAPTDLRRRHSSFLLLDHPDDLRLGEAAFPLVVCSCVAKQTLHQTEGRPGEQVRGQATEDELIRQHVNDVHRPEPATDPDRQALSGELVD